MYPFIHLDLITRFLQRHVSIRPALISILHHVPSSGINIIPTFEGKSIHSF